MYLSRIQLNTKNRHTMIALLNPNIIHGSIVSVTGIQYSGRVLWRIDKFHGNEYLLILSPDKFNWSLLQKQLGFADKPVETKNYEPLLNKVEDGSVWHFRLTCAPSVSKLDEKSEGSRGKRRSIYQPEEQISWLMRRAEKSGFSFSPENITVLKNGPVQFRKKRGDRIVEFYTVTFDGILTVTNSELLKQTLCAGIGSQKAYGQGLLTLMKIHG